MMEEIAGNSGGFSATQVIHGGIYASVPHANYGTEEMKNDLLPRIADGEVSIQSFALTEPNAGLDSTSIDTFAEADDDEYVINGQKNWTSRVDQADYLLLVARTTSKEEVERKTRGISMFLVDIEAAYDQDALETKAISKTASNFVHAYNMQFKYLHIPGKDLFGEEGARFYQVPDGLGEERLAAVVECVGLGELAIERGSNYANEREVFGRKIGQNQAIQSIYISVGTCPGGETGPVRCGQPSRRRPECDRDPRQYRKVPRGGSSLRGRRYRYSSPRRFWCRPRVRCGTLTARSTFDAISPDRTRTNTQVHQRGRPRISRSY